MHLDVYAVNAIPRGIHRVFNEEIADRLVLSLATAKTHVSRIPGKLELRDRVQLVIAAFQAGLVAPS